jgi:hypothetical protein
MNTARKAIAAFLVSGTGALAVAAVDNAITLGEGAFVVAAAVASAGAVYGVNPGPGYVPPGRGA